MASGTSSMDGVEGSPDSAQRRDRAVIAAQACQTCRSRKSKCDEVRPKCGLCRRINQECIYREPLPTKKDKTLVDILAVLARIEGKFDRLQPHLAGDVFTPDNDRSSGHPSKVDTMRTTGHPLKGTKPDNQHSSEYRFPMEMRRGYRHLTVPHKIILWPSIYIHLINSGVHAAADLQHVLQQGTPWFIQQEMADRRRELRTDTTLNSYPAGASPPGHSRAGRVIFPWLTVQRMREYSEAYFNSFNTMAPILDQDSFGKDVLDIVMREGFADGDIGSVLALLVLALGQVGVDGIFDRPISTFNGTPSGFRGGSVEHPPGLELFNEARRRLGFTATNVSLENVQVMLLQATYYESCARHLDFWRSVTMASMSCQVLIKCQNINWNSPYGDLVQRAYWTCVLSEDLYHIDLDLPLSGVQTWEDEVGHPSFQVGQTWPNTGGPPADARSHYHYHFSAMIALRRVISSINQSIHSSANATSELSQDGYDGPPVHLVREMSRQLDQWRTLLPRTLQWQDSDRMDFPAVDFAGRRPNNGEPLFSPDQGPVPVAHKYNIDVVTAQLRTRFYYARFMIYQPFVYKALHFPEKMTPDDRSCCALAIEAALLWPIVLAPPKGKKRLVPHLFAWTQNFMAILLILRMTTESECLAQVCREFVNAREIEETVRLMLEWLQDVRQVDTIAAWSWGLVAPLFDRG